MRVGSRVRGGVGGKWQKRLKILGYGAVKYWTVLGILVSMGRASGKCCWYCARQKMPVRRGCVGTALTKRADRNFRWRGDIRCGVNRSSNENEDEDEIVFNENERRYGKFTLK